MLELRLDLQICTKKNVRSEEREEEEGMQNVGSEEREEDEGKKNGKTQVPCGFFFHIRCGHLQIENQKLEFYLGTRVLDTQDASFLHCFET